MTGKLVKNEKSPSFMVRVTQTMIDEAIRCQGWKCMITEAVLAARPYLEHVWTDATGIHASDPRRNRKYKWFHTNKSLAAFMAWDRGVRLKPFSFKLQDAQIRLRGYRNQGRTAAGAKRRKYTPTGQKRQHPSSARRREFGLCYYIAPEQHVATA
jgi:hypothetical protein